MRNNKNININETPVGTKVKIGLPSYWAHWSKDRHKQLSWFKAKIIEKSETGSFTLMVYPKNWIGQMLVLSGDEYRIVKTL